MFKLDLHTHSTASEDGGLSPDDYRRALKFIDYIAVTDHNSIEQAQYLTKTLSSNIIVGSEVSTAQGELIGLYLSHDVPPGMGLEETMDAIHAQQGLVMAPHPFERWQRASLNLDEFKHLASKIDIIETYNGRSLSIGGRYKTRRFAAQFNLPGASNSDAHGPGGFGRTYTIVKSKPSKDNLPKLLRNADYVNSRSKLKGYLEPSINRRRAKIEDKER